MQSSSDIIRGKILSGIREGRWRSGEQLPPLPALATEFGASRWATDRALTQLIREGVLSRRPKKGTFVRSRSPGEAFRHAPVAIMGVTPQSWLQGDYLGPMMNAFAGELIEHDWIFLHYSADAEKRLRTLDIPLVIAVTPTAAQLSALEQLAAAGIQVLCLGAHVPSARLHYIASDNAQGVTDGCRYLQQLGHRRIGFVICNTLMYDTIERVGAFRQAMEDLRLDDDERLLVCRDHPNGQQALVDEAVNQWFSDAHPPTAIFSGGLGLTTALMRALSERKMSTPRDVSILGFDDAPLLAHLATPLTTIRQPLDIMGRRVVQLLPELLDYTGRPLQLMLPTELVVRASCAQREMHDHHTVVHKGGSDE